MTDLPRLTVTQEQAEQVRRHPALARGMPYPLTIRLPERPTMEEPVAAEQWGESITAHVLVPIPEGTRVEVVYPCDECDTLDVGAMLDHRYGCQKCHGSTFVSVATATLAVVEVEYLMPPDMGECRYHVTLTDIDPVNDCDDGQPV